MTVKLQIWYTAGSCSISLLTKHIQVANNAWNKNLFTRKLYWLGIVLAFILGVLSCHLSPSSRQHYSTMLASLSLLQNLYYPTILSIFIPAVLSCHHQLPLSHYFHPSYIILLPPTASIAASVFSHCSHHFLPSLTITFISAASPHHHHCFCPCYVYYPSLAMSTTLITPGPAYLAVSAGFTPISMFYPKPPSLTAAILYFSTVAITCAPLLPWLSLPLHHLAITVCHHQCLYLCCIIWVLPSLLLSTEIMSNSTSQSYLGISHLIHIATPSSHWVS